MDQGCGGRAGRLVVDAEAAAVDQPGKGTKDQVRPGEHAHGHAKDLAGQPIDRIVIRDPIGVHPDDDLMKVAVVMVSRHIRLLQVVEDGRLAG